MREKWGMGGKPLCPVYKREKDRVERSQVCLVAGANGHMKGLWIEALTSEPGGWWCKPLIPALGEVQTGGSLNSRSA